MEKLKKEYDYSMMMGSNASIAYRPIIDVEISCRTSAEIFPTTALVDSGTDGTILRSDIAKELGIDREHCLKAHLGGIGTLEGFVSNVTIKILNFRISLDNIQVVFADDIPFSVILGQRDLFSKFKIAFKKYENKFSLRLAGE